MRHLKIYSRKIPWHIPVMSLIIWLRLWSSGLDEKQQPENIYLNRYWRFCSMLLRFYLCSENIGFCLQMPVWAFAIHYRAITCLYSIIACAYMSCSDIYRPQWSQASNDSFIFFFGIRRNAMPLLIIYEINQRAQTTNPTNKVPVAHVSFIDIDPARIMCFDPPLQIKNILNKTTENKWSWNAIPRFSWHLHNKWNKKYPFRTFARDKWFTTFGVIPFLVYFWFYFAFFNSFAAGCAERLFLSLCLLYVCMSACLYIADGN